MHRITILKHLPWEWVARIKTRNRLCGALMANAPYIDSITASSKAQQSRNLAMGQLGAEMWTQVYRTGKSPTWNEHDGKYFSESQASWGLRAIAPEFSAKIITAMFRSGHIDSEPRQFTTNWSWFAGPQRLKVACFWGSICELRPVFQWKRYLGCCRYWGSYHNFIACHHCLTANLKTMSQIFGYAVIHPSGLVPVIKHTRWVSTNVPSKFADPWRKTQRDSQTKTRHLQT